MKAKPRSEIYGSSLVVVLLMSLVVSGCGPGKLFGPTLTPTLVPTSTFTPTLTPTATSTSTPTSTNTPTPTPQPTVVSAVQATIRTGPGDAYPVVETIAEGSTLILKARTEDDTWFLVLADSQLEGWVNSSQVDPRGIKLANAPIITSFPKPPPLIQGWKGNPVQTVCVELEGKYTGNFAAENPDKLFDSEDSSYREILAEVKNYIRRIGLTVVEPGGECHATFAVNLTINQYRSYYTNWNTNEGEWCYTGASVSSVITLTDGKNKLNFSSNKTRPQPSAVMSGDCSSSAYFSPESLFTILLGLDKWWGNEALALPLLGSSDTVTKYYLFGYVLDTIRNLGGSGKSYVPSLIDCYSRQCYHYPLGSTSCSGDCPEPNVRWLRTMKSITGKDFQYDLDGWRDWWAAQNP